MKKNKIYSFVATTILLVTLSCQSHEKEADDDFEYYKDNLVENETSEVKLEKQDTLIKVIQNVKTIDTWKAYENEIKLKIVNNTSKINQLKLNSKLKSKTRKQLANLEQNNNDLINLLVVFHAKEQQQLKDFKLEMTTKLNEIDKGVNDSIYRK